MLLQEAPTDLRPDQAWGVTHDALHADPAAALGTVVDRYHAVAAGPRRRARRRVGLHRRRRPDRVRAPTPDRRRPRHPAGPRRPRPADRDARELAASASAAVVGRPGGPRPRRRASSSTRCPTTGRDALLAALRERSGAVPVWALPETPLLRAPTVADLVAACGGTLVHGDADLLDRESLGPGRGGDVDAARHRPALRGRRRHRAGRPRRRRARRAARPPRPHPADPVGGGAQRRVPPLAAGRPPHRRPRRAAADRRRAGRAPWPSRRRWAASRAGSPPTPPARSGPPSRCSTRTDDAGPRGAPRRGRRRRGRGRRHPADVRARPRRAGPGRRRPHRPARGGRGAHPAGGRPGAVARHRPAHPARRRGGDPGPRPPAGGRRRPAPPSSTRRPARGARSSPTEYAALRAHKGVTRRAGATTGSSTPRTSAR